MQHQATEDFQPHGDRLKNWPKNPPASQLPAHRQFEREWVSLSGVECQKSPGTDPKTESSYVSPWKTHTVDMLRYNTGVLAGGLTAIAFSTTATGLAFAHLFTSGPLWLFGLAAGAACGKLYAFKRQFKLQEDQSVVAPSPFERRAHRKASNIVAELCTKAGIPIPHVVISDDVGKAAMLDRSSNPDILIFSNTTLSDLSDREFRFVMAHELSHSDRNYTKLHRLFIAAKTISSAPLLMGGAHWLAQSWNVNNIFTAACAFATALTLGKAIQVTSNLVWNIASRSNESKTDLRAVALTGDPEAGKAFFHGVAKEHKDAGVPDFLLGLTTHPHPKTRIERIGQWFS